ncbi:hypothetical protein K7432_003489 [Basidiobolus ranarum]|uniref:carnosine N-methyltransferase n=1 Tax=Basidiobolus ranarum TaxID=34480 RepID=A0ABR2WZT6_9FUNG
MDHHTAHNEHHGHDHGHGHAHGHEQGHAHDEPEEVHLKEEQDHFRKVVATFASYRVHSHGINKRKKESYAALPEEHKAYIPYYMDRLARIDQAISDNYTFIKAIVADHQIFVEQEEQEVSHLKIKANKERPAVSEFDMDKVRSTLKQFVRDWSEKGKHEREAAYSPILEELERFYGDVPVEERGKLRVLVPGAGLGRLAYDICKKGFSCQGNEFSFYMLLAANFILNRTTETEQFEIYPFVHSQSNAIKEEHILQKVLIPDVLPSGLPSTCDFSMVAGDFLEVYGSESDNIGNWDCIVTCFFIDTAKNMIQYLKTIHGVLKKGGVWINLGPLLYHFENTPGEMSIELTLEEVKELATKIGFNIQRESMMESAYTANVNCMLRYTYNCAFFSAIKE